MILAIGITIDYSRASNIRVSLQAALDASLLAAAKKPEEEREDAAQSFFAMNSAAIQSYGPVASFSMSPDGEFTGTASATVETIFTKLVSISELPVGAQSAVSVTEAGSACIWVLDPDAYESFRVNSGADIVAPDCEIHVHSDAGRAAVFNAGINLEFARICIKGSNVTNNYGSVPNLELDCDPLGDPYEATMPPPPSTACDHNNGNYNGGTVNLSPGVYCGWHNFNGPNVNFDPGVYVIKGGGWNVNGGRWSGDGVTFYFDDTSKIQFNSGVAAEFSPPDSGPYKGIMFYERSGLPESNFVLDDSRGFEISGLVYLPSRNTIYNSGSRTEARELSMVFNTLILNHTRWNLESGSGSAATGSANLRLLH